jgi:general secretion pathway protein G
MKWLMIGVLALTALASGCGKSDPHGNYAAAKTQLQMFELPLNNYQMHVGQFPDTETGLESLRTPPTDGNLQQKWRGPYLQKNIPADPWGNDYEYKKTSEGYRIWSNGADPYDDEDDIIVTSYDS